MNIPLEHWFNNSNFLDVLRRLVGLRMVNALPWLESECRFGTWLLQRGYNPRFDHVGTHQEGCGGLWQQMGHQDLDAEQLLAKIRDML